MSTDLPLSSLSPAQIRLLTFQILTEHFTWSPETLAKLGMECANHTLVSVIEHDVEPFLQQHFAAAYAIAAEEGVDGPSGLNEAELGKGLVQLETLLESGVDKRFDLFELYLLRNVFTIPQDLIPFLELSHQVSPKVHALAPPGQAGHVLILQGLTIDAGCGLTGSLGRQAPGRGQGSVG